MRRLLKTLSLLAVLALTSMASQAHAEDAIGADASPSDEPATRWYGWQTLTADALTVTTFVLAGELDAAPLAVLGVGSYLLAPPIIHIAHDNWLGAGVSFAVRGGSATMFIGGLALALKNFDLDDDPETASERNEERAGVILTVLGFAGIVVSPVIDALIAKEPIEDEGSAWTVLPWVLPQARAGGLAVTGRM